MLTIVNPAAAGGRLGREWPRLRERLATLGWASEERFTLAPGHASELAAEAVACGVERVAVAGGDGTVCEVVEGLHRAGGGTLAILPLGTGNDAARTLGLPTAVEAAARVALDGAARRVDLVAVGDRVVLNAIGLGLTADINQRAARVKVVRGITVYLVTALVSLFRYRAPRVRLRTPELCWEGEMTILAVHNGPTTGGGFNLTPRARPDDGLLDACLVGRVAVPGRLWRLVAAMRGHLGSTPGALELAAPWLELETEEPLAVHLDGNQAELAPPLVRFELLPGALAVVAPPAARS